MWVLVLVGVSVSVGLGLGLGAGAVAGVCGWLVWWVWVSVGGRGWV